MVMGNSTKLALGVGIPAAILAAYLLTKKAAAEPITPCLEGETRCVGFNKYQCINGQMTLVAPNSTECGYVAPVCTRDDVKCIGFDKYACVNNEWVLVESNSAFCGFGTGSPCLIDVPENTDFLRVYWDAVNVMWNTTFYNQLLGRRQGASTGTGLNALEMIRTMFQGFLADGAISQTQMNCANVQIDELPMQ